MAIGKGKYDDLLTEAREKAKASGAVLIILDGEHGMGFSVQAPALMLARLPAMLRYTADMLDDDIPADLKEIARRVQAGDTSMFKVAQNSPH